jgi:endonuclease G, mitochondrial
MPNASIPDENPLHDFLVPLDSIERSAGFLLFDKLPKEKLKMVNGKMEEGKEGGLFGLF